MLIFLNILLIIVLALAAAGYWLFYLASVRRLGDRGLKPSQRMESHRAEIEEGREWFLSQSPEQVTLRSYDGLTLAGDYLQREQPRGTVILFHGYRCDGYRDFGTVYRFYYEQGYSVLSVFQRAHGRSGGAYICFGVKERFDCRDWAKYVYDRFGPEHDIFLAGISMGAATVMMASDLELPPSVRGIIADCGYNSPLAEFREVLKRRLRLPEHPLLDIAQLWAGAMAHYEFDGCSSAAALAKMQIPVLFFHGESDGFVPLRFGLECYAACRSEKQLVTVRGAGHAMCFFEEPERTRRALGDFLAAHSTAESAAPEKMENIFAE